MTKGVHHNIVARIFIMLRPSDEPLRSLSDDMLWLTDQEKTDFFEDLDPIHVKSRVISGIA